LGIFADGKAGAGWNGVGVDSYLGVAGQGVTGLMAAAGYQPDWPGQMQAQAVGLAALSLFGFFVAWLLLMPPAILTRLLRPRPVATIPAAALVTEHATPPASQLPEAAEVIEETAVSAPHAVAEPPAPSEAPAESEESDPAEVA
jgi:Amt family ammonium transporter